LILSSPLMESLIQIEERDRQLLEAIGESMAEAARRSGEWIACKPGCTQCCFGPFGISKLDAMRLRRGMQRLAADDPARAAAVRARADSYIRIAGPLYPGDPVSGELHDADALPDSLDELPCPALDPATGLCDLYDARPITCRTFGPATQLREDALGACELCYTGATEEQLMACAVEVDPAGLENALLEDLDTHGAGGMTIVAFAVLNESSF
jgi:Fe-S-cluster containining protein